MKTQRPPANVREAAVALLRPFCPDLTPANLVPALRTFSEEPAEAGPPLPAGKLLTVGQAAERLSCGSRTVWRLISAGRLPKRMLGRRSARIPEAAVVRLAEGDGE